MPEMLFESVNGRQASRFNLITEFRTLIEGSAAVRMQPRPMSARRNAFAPRCILLGLALFRSRMVTDIWNRPVEVIVESGDHFRTVHNSREALETLMTCWPTAKVASFSAARKSCLTAVRGKTPSDVAAPRERSRR